MTPPSLKKSVSLIQRQAPSKRSMVNEFQTQHLCALCTFLESRTLAHFGVRTHRDLPLEVDDEFTSLPEYDLFSSGVYACGFVCSDLSPDADLDAVERDPEGVLDRMNLPRIRHYLHTLLRSERANWGGGSVIYSALRAGVLSALVQRIKDGEDLFQVVL